MPQLARRLDSQLRAESFPQIAVRPERVRGATGSVERGHQEMHDGFFERMLGGHDFEVVDHLGVVALCDAGLGQRSPRQQMTSFETTGLDLDEGFVAETGERTTPPETQRLLDQGLTSGRIGRQGISCEVDEAIELVHVDLVGFQRGADIRPSWS